MWSALLIRVSGVQQLGCSRAAML